MLCYFGEINTINLQFSQSFTAFVATKITLKQLYHDNELRISIKIQHFNQKPKITIKKLPKFVTKMSV